MSIDDQDGGDPPGVDVGIRVEPGGDHEYDRARACEGVLVCTSTWNVFPEILYGMAVGLVVAVVVFRKKRLSSR